jgi:hypothetical protein
VRRRQQPAPAPADRIADCAPSSSISRSVAPEARSRSPHTSASTATLPATTAMYSAVWLSWPAVICPAITACTPPYRPYSSEPNTPMMTNAVSIERTPVRRIEVAKACSLASPEAACLGALLREALHHRHRVEDLAGDAAGVGDAVLAGARELAHAAADQRSPAAPPAR